MAREVGITLWHNKSMGTRLNFELRKVKIKDRPKSYLDYIAEEVAKGNMSERAAKMVKTGYEEKKRHST